MKRRNTLSIICILLVSAILCSFWVLPVSAVAEAEAASLAKLDLALREKIETTSPDEKIPVAIWYTDIDQSKVDRLTFEKVGYSQDDIVLAYEMPSIKLIRDLETGEENTTDEIQSYMKRTEYKRDNELKRTNAYVMTRREFSREKYNEKSAKIAKDIAVEEKDILFKSQYTPMIIMTLTASQIESLKSNPLIESVSYYEESEIILDSIDTALENTKVNKLKTDSELALSGEGVKIGIIENNSVLISTEEQDERYIVPDTYPPTTRTLDNGVTMTDYGNVVVVGNTTYNPNSRYREHPNCVADTLFSVAPNITLYSSNLSYINIEAMITDGVQLLSCSVGNGVLESSLDYGYTTMERWFDHLIAEHNVTLIKSGGNNGANENDYTYEDVDENGNKVIKQVYGPRNTSPGMAYNVITVGAYCDTTTPSTLCSYSSYKNSITRADGTVIAGCSKPDVIAPAEFNG